MGPRWDWFDPWCAGTYWRRRAGPPAWSLLAALLLPLLLLLLLALFGPRRCPFDLGASLDLGGVLAEKAPAPVQPKDREALGEEALQRRKRRHGEDHHGKGRGGGHEC